MQRASTPPNRSRTSEPGAHIRLVAPAMMWRHFWIYVFAPVLGMLVAAQLLLAVRGVQRLACAKLLHPSDARCIHCGYEPSNVQTGHSQGVTIRSIEE
jgi:aquaporin Z